MFDRGKMKKEFTSQLQKIHFEQRAVLRERGGQ